MVAAALAGAASAAPRHDVLVAVREGGAAARIVTRADGELVSSGLGLWRLDADEAERTLPLLERRGLLRYSAPNRTRSFQGFARGDPLAADAWHLERVGARGLEPPGPGVPLALIDSLVDPDYPELAQRPATTLLSEHTSCTGNDTPHATIVAAIGAAPANGVGTVGVYPTAELWSVNACNLADADIIAAMDAAVARGASVITLPVGGPGYSRPLYEAVLRAVDSGSLVVAAAGNYFTQGDPLVYPAAYPHVLTVGSLDRENRPSRSSSSGVDIAAPGEAIQVLDPASSDRTLTVTGTSFATPIVAGAAAWIWTRSPSLEASQVDELLRRAAQDVATAGTDARTGAGLLALPAALGAKPPVPDPLEPNDDVDLVSRNGILEGKEQLRSGSRLVARLDAHDDPRDVYRVVVPAHGLLRVRAAGRGRALRLSLWGPRTATVTRSRSRDRLDTAPVPARGARSLTYRNRRGSAVTVYVEVRPRSSRGEYALRVGIG